MFRPSRPDFIETPTSPLAPSFATSLFRPSRPDFIETTRPASWDESPLIHCSGLLGRTSLRPWGRTLRKLSNSHCSGLLGRTSLRLECQLVLIAGQVILFRPSRPDFIETITPPEILEDGSDCSGLLGRTSLRLALCLQALFVHGRLFRPSRPDFIETTVQPTPLAVFLVGLFRPSRPDFIETLVLLARSEVAWADCSGLLGRTSLRHRFATKPLCAL